MPRGKLIVIAAPSGCGKTTIARAILQRHPAMLFSVSATTRPLRQGEVNGKDYFFLSKEDFEDRVKAGDLVEWEEIYGDYYGTLRSEVDRALAAGRVMLFDVDVNGALSIRRLYPNESVLIFIAPPSLEELRHRLENRKTEDATTVAMRMARVPMELQRGAEFDVQVLNDDLQKAIEQVDATIRDRTAGLRLDRFS